MKSLILWLTWAVNISTKEVLIFTYAYNRPEFIALQNKCFKKFLKEDFDFVVFNDARDVKDETAIQNECSKLGIQCIRIPQEIHNKPYLQRFPGEDFNHPSVRNSNVVQYSLDHYGFSHKGYLLLFDSDVFLINPFSITDFMQDCSVAGRLQVKNKNNISINYLWIGIVFFKMGELPNINTINFNCGLISGVPVDAGGFTHLYLKSNPQVPVKFFSDSISTDFFCNACKSSNIICVHVQEELKKSGFSKEEVAFLSKVTDYDLFIKNIFFHYRAGSNWNYKPEIYHIEKQNALKDFIDAITRPLKRKFAV